MKAETCEIRTRNKPKCLFKNEETIRERLTVNYLFTISTSGHSIVKLLQNKALVFFTFSFHRPFYSSFFYHIAAIFFSLFSLFSIFFFSPSGFLLFCFPSWICSCKGHKLLYTTSFPPSGSSSQYWPNLSILNFSDLKRI